MTDSPVTHQLRHDLSIDQQLALHQVLCHHGFAGVADADEQHRWGRVGHGWSSWESGRAVR
jgi:hypothetical protein